VRVFDGAEPLDRVVELAGLAEGRVVNETVNLAYGQGNSLVHAAELIAAARMQLELLVIPSIAEPRLRFQTLVAANVPVVSPLRSLALRTVGGQPRHRQVLSAVPHASRPNP